MVAGPFPIETAAGLITIAIAGQGNFMNKAITWLPKEIARQSSMQREYLSHSEQRFTTNLRLCSVTLPAGAEMVNQGYVAW